jgi:hypothetical protein
MSDHDLPPLDADVRALVERTRDEPRPSLEAQLRVQRALDGILGPAGGSAPSGGEAHPALGSARQTARLAASFVLGAAVGAIGMKAASPRLAAPPIPIAATSPVEPQAVRSPSLAAASPRIEVSPASSAEPRASGNPRGPDPSAAQAQATRRPAVVGSDLAAERALLDGARHALESEDAAAALAAVDLHQRRFPNGLLAQEREAIAVRALLALGRRDEAAKRATRFHARFPDSPLWPTIEDSLSRTP